MTGTRKESSFQGPARPLVDRVGALTPAKRALLASRLHRTSRSEDTSQDGLALVAYVVARDGNPPESSDLRRFLGERLPQHLIPAAFVFVDALPRTSGGKVDRRALPHAVPGSAHASTRVRPRTELERTLAGVWQEVLRIEQVGVSDNFFDLGGHSLLMMRVQVRMRELLDVAITVMDLFRHPTVGALAVFVAEMMRARAD
jgi:aryl carrier-like protein